jgi:hypothetical protein
MAFKGILNDNTTKFALIVNEDARMGSIGMGSYNKKTLTKILKGADTQKDAVAALVDPCLTGKEGEDQASLDSKADELIKAFSGENADDAHYFKFDQATKKYKYESIEGTELQDLMKHWDDGQKNPEKLAQDEEKTETINEVKNSLEGCIVFTPTGEQNFRKSRVYFRDISKSDDSRNMIINGDPKIAAVPRRTTGAKYDFARSHNVQKKGLVDDDGNETDGFPQIGRYSNSSANKEISDQAVAAKMRMVYNKSLGYFESGTQTIMARLIDDLSAPTLKDIDLSAVDSLKFEDMYKEGGKGYFGGFETAFALPLNVQNGNPHTYGPNVIGKSDEFKKEKIRVVNRFPVAFANGDLVLCSLIENEWIVHPIGGSEVELEEVAFTVGKWSFTKMIADSDAYFKDDRWYQSSEDDTTHQQYLRHDTYGTFMREQFYHDLGTNHSDDTAFADDENPLTKITKMNSLIVHTIEELKADPSIVDGLALPNDPDVQPSTRYVQATSFDMVGAHMGGNNSHGNIIGRTNRVVNTDAGTGNEVAEYNNEVPLFWGPVFDGGYNSSQCRKLLNQKPPFSPSGNFEFFGASQALNINDKSDANNALRKTGQYMFNDSRDFSFLQVPADIATNATLGGEYGSPIEHISLLASLEKSNRDDMVKAYASFLSSEKRFSALVDSTGKSIFDLKANTSTEITFVPLSFHMGGNADQASKELVRQTYNTYAGARSFLRDSFKDVDHLWGNMFDREKSLTSHTFTAETGGIDGDDEIVVGTPNLPYNRYIKKLAHRMPDNTPFFYSDSVSRSRGANLVGITAARNTFGMGEGGAITFTTAFMMGCNGKSGSSVGNITWKSSGRGEDGRMFQSGGISYDIPQWGTRDTGETAMGHTSLYVKVYDHWPQEQTIFDARYFCPLFFCAGPYNTVAAFKELAGSDSDEDTTAISNWDASNTDEYNTAVLANLDYARKVDKIEYDEDFRIPTYGNPKDSSIDNTAVEAGNIIDRFGCVSPRQALRKPSEYKVNTVCRGMMLSPEGGFRHYKRTIGVTAGDLNTGANTETIRIVTAGTNFFVDDEIVIDQDRSVKIKVTETDTDGGIVSISLLDQGKDFHPLDFNTSVAKEPPETEEGEDPPEVENDHGVIISVPSADGSDASILFMLGQVYDRISETNYPKQQGSLIKLTPASQPGDQGPISGSKSGSISIQKPNSNNLYDAYYYHVNDITHVDSFPFQSGGAGISFKRNGANNENVVDQSQAVMQFVTLNISAT